MPDTTTNLTTARRAVGILMFKHALYLVVDEFTRHVGNDGPGGVGTRVTLFKRDAERGLFDERLVRRVSEFELGSFVQDEAQLRSAMSSVWRQIAITIEERGYDPDKMPALGTISTETRFGTLAGQIETAYAPQDPALPIDPTLPPPANNQESRLGRFTILPNPFAAPLADDFGTTFFNTEPGLN